MEIATFAGGCFWCTEAVFKMLKGVDKVTSGYTGGTMENPTYEQVSAGITGHAEAINIKFDPKTISYDDLLYVFFKTHDPTTINRQGADVGTQYRSAIFYHDEEQRNKAEKMITKLQNEAEFASPIVTEIIPFEIFYEAEDYHKDYYANNPDKMYCKLVIDPKINKLKKEFKEFLA